jgi:hypothetical protein
MGLSMTSLPAEADGTVDSTVAEGVKGGSIFPTSLSSTQRAHNSHITSNKCNFFIVLRMQIYCVACWLIVVCLGDRSGAQWWPWEGSGRHGQHV